MPLADCRLIDLPRVPNVLGNLTFIEGERHVPFAIQRVDDLYDVPGGAERGGHAHRELQQLIIAMSGSFDVVLDDGYQKQRFHLNRSYQGLYVRTLIWRELDNPGRGSRSLRAGIRRLLRSGTLRWGRQRSGSAASDSARLWHRAG